MLLPEIVNIVREAAHIMTEKAFTVREKHGLVDLVTSSDVAVQSFLCKRLTELLPGSGFLCEEDDVKSLDSRYVWIIDPIDGTMNFARHIPECAICVALEVDGQMETGVVYNPTSTTALSTSITPVLTASVPATVTLTRTVLPISSALLIV